MSTGWQDVEGFGDQPWGVLHEPGMPLLQLTTSLGREGALDGCFSQDLHCEPVAVCVTQAIAKPGFVVRQVDLPRWSEQLRAIHFPNIVQRNPVSTVHPDVVPETGEEGLHVLRDANAEVLVDRPRHTVVGG